MVFELIQNSWDEASTRCDVTLEQATAEGARVTRLICEDDNPEGFGNLADAFTLFRSTAKRAEPEKRGRFNYGEKIVLARAIHGRIETTKGTVVFSASGRRILPAARERGSRVTRLFEAWTEEEFAEAATFVRRILPPTAIEQTLNGERVAAPEPIAGGEAILPTEFLKDNGVGALVMTKTKRRTRIEFYPKVGSEAMLYEMGLPVCAIEGEYSVNVLQKIPVSQDRTTVSLPFLRDLYAEMLNVLNAKVGAETLGLGVVRLAMESDRVTPTLAKEVFHEMYGEKAVIQSHRADADQEAARQGFTLVPSRTFGGDVNAKLREAGVVTAHERFGRNLGSGERGAVKPVNPKAGKEEAFLAYATVLAAALYEDDPTYDADSFHLRLGEIGRQTEGVNFGKTEIYFNVGTVRRMADIVADGTSLIVHELAHCRGAGHDGVYDREYERLANRAVVLALERPELFKTYRDGAERG